MSKIIRRAARLDSLTIRANGEGDDGEKLHFRGHAAVFNQPTLIGSTRWGFVEWIEPGAFESVLEDDVRFLFNHDGLPLARTTNGTLKLSEDKTGLVSEADLAPVTLSRDLSTLIERGDVTQMSFAFYPGQERVGTISVEDPDKAGHKGLEVPDEWDGVPYRAVSTMERLFDVSAVTYPAYEGTDAEMVSARFRVASDDEIRRVRDSVAAVAAVARYSHQQKFARVKVRAYDKEYINGR